MLRVTPLYGSNWSSLGQAEEPECTLIEYGGCRVLCNIGWWATAADAPMQFPDLPDHDCVVLTDSTLQASGGLPMYYAAVTKKSQSDPDARPPPPIYATFPTVKMGQMTLYDLHAAICLDGGRPPFTLEELDNAIAAVKSIKYSQAMLIPDPISGTPSLSVTAHTAGFVVGGAFYVLQRLQDETTVVITSHYHMAKELHLDSSTILKEGSTPDVFVGKPGGPAFRKLRALAYTTPPVLPPLLISQAERNLTETVMAVLRRDGNVLLPVDAAGRVLELVLLLNQHWERQRLSATYNLIWFGPMVSNTAEFVRSQLEWMAVKLGTQFDSMSGHPFNLTAVRLCTSLNELETLMEENQNPTCVLATGLSLEDGPARDVLLKWADDPDNAVIFTDSSQCYLRRWCGERENGDISGVEALNPIQLDVAEDQAEGVEGRIIGSTVESPSEWTTAGQLLLAWAEAKLQRREMDDSVMVDVNVPQRTPLAGAELKAFLANEEAARQRKEKEAEKRAILREVEIAKGQLRLGEEETVTATSETKNSSTKASHVSVVRPKKKSRFDSSLFLKFSKPLHLMFEVREEAVGIGQPDSTAKYGIGESVGRSGEVLEDDYGIAVMPERFTDIVSGVNPAKFSSGSGRIGDDVLRRGFGYGVDGGRPSKTGQNNASANAARVSEDEEQDDFDTGDEQAIESSDLSEGSGIIRGRNGRPPTKVSLARRKVEVLSEVFCVLLEGRVDARAARQSVRALQPRQVIVLGGKSPGGDIDLVDEVGQLAEAAQSFASENKIVQTPTDGETAQLNVGHAAYAVRLINTPFLSPDEQDLEDEPEPIEPLEIKLGPCTVSLLNHVATGQKVATDGSIVLAPRPPSVRDAPKIYVSDGEVLLTDLRAEMIGQGMKADYSAHTGFSQLIINGKIIVQKHSGGRISIEGPLCEDFFAVRSIICGQYVTM